MLEKEKRNVFPKLNRAQVKLVAIICMTFNHAAVCMLEPGTPIFALFESIGYFTAITMNALMVEGFEHTSSRKKYLERILLFALISQLPFSMMTARIIKTIELNVMFSFLISIMMLMVIESEIKTWIKVCLVPLLVAVGDVCDWGSFFQMMTLAFWYTRGSRLNRKAAYVFLIYVRFLMRCTAMIHYMHMPVIQAVEHSFYATAGLIASTVVMLWFYSGKQEEKHGKAGKWFFYIYYPLHITILVIISCATGHYHRL